MLRGIRFEVVASRLFQALDRVEALDRRHRGAPSRWRRRRRALATRVVVADDDPSLPVEPALAAEELDAVFLQPRLLARVVEVVDHLVAAGEDRLGVELAGHRLRTPGTRRASSSSSPGRSSAFEGMQA